MSEKFPAYASQVQVMQRIKNAREDHNILKEDAARIVREATGYHFTVSMYNACELGVTKNVPLWVIIALLGSEELGIVSADEFFGDVLYRW